MPEDRNNHDLSVALVDTEEFCKAVEEAAGATENLQAAIEQLQEASISVEDPLGGAPNQISFDDLYDLRVAINIQPSQMPTVICPTCERRVWNSDRRNAMRED